MCVYDEPFHPCSLSLFHLYFFSLPSYSSLSLSLSVRLSLSLLSLSLLSLSLSLSVRLSDVDGAGGSVCRPRDATQTEGRVSAVAFALWICRKAATALFFMTTVKCPLNDVSASKNSFMKLSGERLGLLNIAFWVAVIAWISCLLQIFF